MWCVDCGMRGNCTKICDELERYLQRKESDMDLLGIKRLYSDSWIKLKEFPVDPVIMDVRALEPKDGEKGIKDDLRRLNMLYKILVAVLQIAAISVIVPMIILIWVGLIAQIFYLIKDARK